MNLASIPASSIERLLLTKPEVLEAFRRDRNLVVQVMNDRRLTPAAKGRIMRIINDGRLNPMIGPGNEIYNERMITNESFMVNDMVIPRPIPIVQHQTIMMSRYISSNGPMIQPPLNTFKQMPINMAELNEVHAKPEIAINTSSSHIDACTSEPIDLNHDHWGRELTMNKLRNARKELNRYKEEWTRLIQEPILSWYLNDELVLRLNVEQSILEVLLGPKLSIQEQLDYLHDFNFPLFTRLDGDKSISTEYERYNVKHPMQAYRFGYIPKSLDYIHAFIYCLFRCV